MKLCFFLALLVLTIPNNSWSQAPERSLEDFFSSLSREDLRTLTDTKDKVKISENAKALNKTLQSKELGKKCTLQCVNSGETMVGRENTTTLISNVRAGRVRVNGIQVYVTVYSRVPASKVDKIKECRADRKMFVSGTVSEIHIYGGLSILGSSKYRINGADMISLQITIDADDLGPAK